ncbi:MAG: efflux RND transporter permease subunit [Bacteroidales bacterium]|nr:efflux RND transporter permease subunit [Bacteroidales bacterium]
MYSYTHIPSGFLPEWDEGTIVHDYIAPPGSSIEGTKSMLSSIAKHIMEMPEVESYSLRTGRSLAHPRTHANDGDFVINLKEKHKRSSFEIMNDLRQFDKTYEPRLEPELFQVLPDRLNDLSGEIAPIVLKVFGNNLLLILAFGILLVFTILLFEFRSFLTSGVILLGTLLSVSGVFLMLWITKIPLDISAFMGMIMIVGVVVNNGILLIDYTEKYLKDHPDVSESLLMASRVRMRPILMTTIATIFGFLPLALALGEGAQMLQPLAISMIGGMSLSMFLSLLVIPGLYRMVHR